MPNVEAVIEGSRENRKRMEVFETRVAWMMARREAQA